MKFFLAISLSLFYSLGRFAFPDYGRDLIPSLAIVSGQMNSELMFSRSSKIINQFSFNNYQLSLYVLVFIFSFLRIMSTTYFFDLRSSLVIEFLYLISCPFRFEWGSIRIICGISVYILLMISFSKISASISSKHRINKNQINCLLLFIILPALFHYSLLPLSILSILYYQVIQRKNIIFPAIYHSYTVVSSFSRSTYAELKRYKILSFIISLVVTASSYLIYSQRNFFLAILFSARNNDSRLNSLSTNYYALEENIGDPNLLRVGMSLLITLSVFLYCNNRVKNNLIDFNSSRQSFVELSLSSILSSITLYFLFLFDFSSSSRFLDLSLPFCCIVSGSLITKMLVNLKVIRTSLILQVSTLLPLLFSSIKEMYYASL